MQQEKILISFFAIGISEQRVKVGHCHHLKVFFFPACLRHQRHFRSLFLWVGFCHSFQMEIIGSRYENRTLEVIYKLRNTWQEIRALSLLSWRLARNYNRILNRSTIQLLTCAASIRMLFFNCFDTWINYVSFNSHRRPSEGGSTSSTRPSLDLLI